MTRTQDFGCGRLGGVLGHLGSNHKNGTTQGLSPSEPRHFFFRKEFWCVWTRRNFYGTFSGPVEYSTTHFWWNPQVKNFKKKRFFQNCLKFDLNEFRYRIRVQNGSKTPQGLISGHISLSRTLPAILWKFEFLAKIVILAIFDKWHHGRPYGRKWLEMWLVAGNGFSDPLRYLKIPWMRPHER